MEQIPKPKARGSGRGVLAGLDIKQIITIDSDDEHDDPEHDQPKTRHTTRQAVKGRTAALYDQKYHPMDDYTGRRRRSGAVKKEQITKLEQNSDSDSPDGISVGSDNSGDESMEDEPSPEPDNVRRSSRLGTQTRRPLYNMSRHPQDRALEALGIKRKAKRRSRLTPRDSTRTTVTRKKIKTGVKTPEPEYLKKSWEEVLVSSPSEMSDLEGSDGETGPGHPYYNEGHGQEIAHGSPRDGVPSAGTNENGGIGMIGDHLNDEPDNFPEYNKSHSYNDDIKNPKVLEEQTQYPRTTMQDQISSNELCAINIQTNSDAPRRSSKLRQDDLNLLRSGNVYHPDKRTIDQRSVAPLQSNDPQHLKAGSLHPATISLRNIAGLDTDEADNEQTVSRDESDAIDHLLSLSPQSTGNRNPMTEASASGQDSVSQLEAHQRTVPAFPPSSAPSVGQAKDFSNSRRPPLGDITITTAERTNRTVAIATQHSARSLSHANAKDNPLINNQLPTEAHEVDNLGISNVTPQDDDASSPAEEPEAAVKAVDTTLQSMSTLVFAAENTSIYENMASTTEALTHQASHYSANHCQSHVDFEVPCSLPIGSVLTAINAQPRSTIQSTCLPLETQASSMIAEPVSACLDETWEHMTDADHLKETL